MYEPDAFLREFEQTSLPSTISHRDRDRREVRIENVRDVMETDVVSDAVWTKMLRFEGEAQGTRNSSGYIRARTYAPEHTRQNRAPVYNFNYIG